MLECACDGDFLSAAERKAVRLLSWIELKPLAESPGFLGTVFPPQICRKTQELRDGGAVIKHSFRWNISYIFKDFAPPGGDIHPEDGSAARAGMDEPEKNADGRALSRSVGTDEAEKFSLSDVQAEVDDAAGFSVVFREMSCCDDVHLCPLSAGNKIPA